MTIHVPDTYVYLDWAATAPLCPEALDAMSPFLQPGQANVHLGMNANSLHAPGRAAFEAMELARKEIARDLNATRPSEIVFTSGATEADNAAVVGMAEGECANRRKRGGARFTPRVITSAIEHEAVLAPVAELKKRGYDVVRLKPDKAGFIDPAILAEALTDETVLVSVQLANSEVGSIQDVKALAELAHERKVLFHTDATQALGKMPVDVQDLGVDAASFSAHKVGGPKGVGMLYLKARTPFCAQMLGGGQEDGRRSSTQNVCGIAGMAAACHAVVQDVQAESARERVLRDELYGRLAAIDGVRATVEVEPGSERYLPNIVHVIVHGLESETLVLRLDQMGYGVSGGSACSSHSLEPSSVLKAMGIDADEAYGALRVSMGRLTQRKDLEGFASAFEQVVAR